MKTVFNEATRDELIGRINLLDENSAAKWGKMTVAQMVKHCTQWDEMALGKTKYKQSLIGRLFGKMALKDMMQDKPVKKGMPTVPAFKITGQPDFTEEKRKWITLLGEYKNMPEDGYLHPFFGQMTKIDTGIMAYKHMDHHLKQFGC